MDLLILLSHEWRIMPFSCFMAGILYIVDTVKAIIYQHINWNRMTSAKNGASISMEIAQIANPHNIHTFIIRRFSVQSEQLYIWK